MSKSNKMYRQVQVKKGDNVIVTWVEEELAKIGKNVYLVVDGVKDYQWTITNVWEKRSTLDQLNQIRDSRKNLGSIDSQIL